MKILIRNNCLIVSEHNEKPVKEACKRLDLTAVPAESNQLLIEGKKEKLFDFLFLLSKDFDIDLV